MTEQLQQIRIEEGSMLPQLARAAVEHHFHGGGEGWASGLVDRLPFLAQPAAVFVTIRTRDGNLRGCRGTLEPAHANLLEEIRAVALSSALNDGRFPQVKAEELPELTFEVSVVHAPEPVETEADLNPEVYGVILVTPDGRRGVMLPGVEGLETPEQQVDATRRKVGIAEDETVRMARFRVEKFKETLT